MFNIDVDPPYRQHKITFIYYKILENHIFVSGRKFGETFQL